MCCVDMEILNDWNFVSTEQMVPKPLKLPQCAFWCCSHSHNMIDIFDEITTAHGRKLRLCVIF